MKQDGGTKRARGKLAYSIRTLATSTDIGKSTINAEIRDGKLIARKCRGRTIVTRADAEAWLAALPLARRPHDPDKAPLCEEAGRERS